MDIGICALLSYFTLFIQAKFITKINKFEKHVFVCYYHDAIVGLDGFLYQHLIPIFFQNILHKFLKLEGLAPCVTDQKRK